MSALLGAASALLAGLAVTAWPMPRGGSPRRGGSPTTVRTRAEAGVPLVTASVAAALAVMLWSGPVGAACAGLAAFSSVRGRTARRDAARTQAQALSAFEGCGVLVDELRAGRLPVEALRAAAAVDGALTSAARAAEVGGDVVGALRSTGVRAHRLVAAAWQVAERQGSGLVDALVRVLDGLRADRRTARLVASELASARSTARLLVILPLLALGVAVLSVDGVVGFLASRPGGLVVLSGVALLQFGTSWIDRIARSVARGAA